MKRGTEYIDPVPMNWGTTHAAWGIRVEGWIVLRSMFATANGVRFVAWLTTHLLPAPAGDVMDNLRAHHNPRVAPACRAHGVRVLAPILPGPAIEACSRSSTSARSLRERHTRCVVARRARYRVTPSSGLSTPAIRLNSGDPWG